MEDALGNILEVGDIVLFATTSGRHAVLVEREILEIIDNGADKSPWSRYSIKIKGANSSKAGITYKNFNMIKKV